MNPLDFDDPRCLRQPVQTLEEPFTRVSVVTATYSHAFAGGIFGHDAFSDPGWLQVDFCGCMGFLAFWKEQIRNCSGVVYSSLHVSIYHTMLHQNTPLVAYISSFL